MKIEWIVTDRGAEASAGPVAFAIERSSSDPVRWRARVASEWIDRIQSDEFVSLAEAIHECDRCAKALLRMGPSAGPTIVDQRAELVADLPTFVEIVRRLADHLGQSQAGERHRDGLLDVADTVGVLVPDRVSGGLAHDEAIRACDACERTFCALTTDADTRRSCAQMIADAKAYLRERMVQSKSRRGLRPVLVKGVE